MKAEFLPEAEIEFREAARYYEKEAPGVGIAFISEVHKSISRDHRPSTRLSEGKGKHP